MFYYKFLYLYFLEGIKMSEKIETNPIHKKSLLAGFIGNILEWYDFTVYGFFATIIGAQFFPDEDKIVQLISALECLLRGI